LLLPAAVAACQLLAGIGAREEASPGDAAESPSDATAGPEDVLPPLPDAGAPEDAGCGIGLTACGGACVALSSHRDHCGACGHACLTAACDKGACVPELVTASSHGPVVAVANGELFFRDVDDSAPLGYGTLKAYSLDGGAERDVLPVGVYFGMVPLGSTRWLLWEEFAAMPRLRIVDLATGAVERTLFDSNVSGPIRGAAVHGQDIYFTTRGHGPTSSGHVRYVRADGTGLSVVRTISEEQHGATAAVDFTDDFVYFGVEDRNTLNRLTRTPKPASTVIDEAGAPDASAQYIHVDRATERLTWIIGGELRELPLDGGPPTRYPTGALNLHTWARDGDFLYATSLVAGDDAGNKSSLVRIDLRSHTTLVLGTALPSTGQIALDERYVYMARYNGAIYRVAR